MDVPERYVRLCLRVDRHVDGLVDAYFGPPEWKEAVDREELVEPGRLREEARLLLDAVDEGVLEEDRRRWLRGQLEALACVTARLAGEEMRWSDEVERCLGLRPTRAPEADLEAVHRRLDAALPGSGSLGERYVAWDARNTVTREMLVPALERLKSVLGPRAHELAPMPTDESVDYELVSGPSWIAYNWYAGGYRSRIEVNADLPISVVLLVELAAHEAYPGHHTERTTKEARLHRQLGRAETAVVLSLAPESLVAEGIATNALAEALGPEPWSAISESLRDIGVSFDPSEANAIQQAETALDAVGTNAAFRLHEDGAAAKDVEEYVREWTLQSSAKAARAVAFIADPMWRAYVPAYTDGRRLCRAFADRAPGNFSRLLTEQLTTADLLA